MLEILVIADDFTGALDTATQFSKNGIKTVAYTSSAAFLENKLKDVTACVVNTDSRHLKSDDAYQIVRTIVEYGIRQGAHYIYKKTDSALRGNIGKELEAVLDGTAKKSILFAPAYPKNDRVTIDGVQYYKGVPVAKTVYGRDPINPVCTSDISEVISSQTTVKTVKIPTGRMADAPSEKVIYIHDAATEQEISDICDTALKQERPVLMAGCAGLAEALAQKISKGEAVQTDGFSKVEKVLVVSGSLNPVSYDQLAYAKSRSCPSIILREAVELDDSYPATPEYRSLISKAKSILNEKKMLILESCASEKKSSISYKQPAEAIGRIARDILQGEEGYGLVVFGGDTLLAITNQLYHGEIEPKHEIVTGIPLSIAVDYHNTERVIVTKSGGFGEKNVLETICSYLTGK